MDIQSVVKDLHYKVLVNCMTYNQSQYIEDALNGFAMQQTSFPFVCLVMDDASTDGEQDVIRAFLSREGDLTAVMNYDIDEAEVIVLPHKTNKNCTLAVYLLKKNLYGTGKKRPLIDEWRKYCKYEALCEGDDCWIDPYKLQKQVDILETDDTCSLTLSNGYSGSSLDNKSLINPYGPRLTGYLDMHTLLISKRGLVPTASMCFRISMRKMPDFFYDSPVGDKPLRMWCAINGKVFYDNVPEVFYRQNANGSFNERVAKDKTYAYYIYSKFCEFLDNFNNYTQNKYASEIKYMKEKEEFSYLCRVNDPSRYKCHFFLHHTPIRYRIKQIIKNSFLYRIWKKLHLGSIMSKRKS